MSYSCEYGSIGQSEKGIDASPLPKKLNRSMYLFVFAAAVVWGALVALVIGRSGANHSSGVIGEQQLIKLRLYIHARDMDARDCDDECLAESIKKEFKETRQYVDVHDCDDECLMERIVESRKADARLGEVIGEASQQVVEREKCSRDHPWLEAIEFTCHFEKRWKVTAGEKQAFLPAVNETRAAYVYNDAKEVNVTYIGNRTYPVVEGKQSTGCHCLCRDKKPDLDFASSGNVTNMSGDEVRIVFDSEVSSKLYIEWELYCEYFS
eukprot:scaffold23661_cov117-Cylindrotheca_fusiformis.AAC.1